MALPKKGFRKIIVDENQFLWKVRKKISWNEIHNEPLGIPIQHIDGGQLLTVYIGYSRSYFDKNNEFPITPALIEKCIRQAINEGWKFKEKGKHLKLDYSDIALEIDNSKTDFQQIEK